MQPGDGVVLSSFCHLNWLHIIFYFCFICRRCWSYWGTYVDWWWEQALPDVYTHLNTLVLNDPWNVNPLCEEVFQSCLLIEAVLILLLFLSLHNVIDYNFNLDDSEGLCDLFDVQMLNYWGSTAAAWEALLPLVEPSDLFNTQSVRKLPEAWPLCDSPEILWTVLLELMPFVLFCLFGFTTFLRNKLPVWT